VDDVLRLAYSDHGKKIGVNLLERIKLQNKMNSSKELGMTEVELCMRHNPDFTEDWGILKFFKHHLFTHDPRKNMLDLYGLKHPQLPFLLFDYQKQFVRDVVEAVFKGEDLLCEKSRDEGISWLVISVALWFWLRREGGNDILIGSRKFDYVDKKLMKFFDYQIQ